MTHAGLLEKGTSSPQPQKEKWVKKMMGVKMSHIFDIPGFFFSLICRLPMFK